MARKSAFKRLGDHHLAGEHSPGETKPPHFSDPRVEALFVAIGAATDAEVPAALLAYLIHQWRTQAVQALSRHGIDADGCDPGELLRLARSKFGSDSEPGFAANLLVRCDSLETLDDPGQIGAAIRMFDVCALSSQLQREFRDGPAIARERYCAPLRSEGGRTGSAKRRVASGSANQVIREHYEGYVARNPGASQRQWSRDAAKSIGGRPEALRRKLGRILSERTTH